MFILVSMLFGLVTGELEGLIWGTFWYLQLFGHISKSLFVQCDMCLPEKNQKFKKVASCCWPSFFYKEGHYVGRFGDWWSWVVEQMSHCWLAGLILCRYRYNKMLSSYIYYNFFDFGGKNWSAIGSFSPGACRSGAPLSSHRKIACQLRYAAVYIYLSNFFSLHGYIKHKSTSKTKNKNWDIPRQMPTMGLPLALQ